MRYILQQGQNKYPAIPIKKFPHIYDNEDCEEQINDVCGYIIIHTKEGMRTSCLLGSLGVGRNVGILAEAGPRAPEHEVLAYAMDWQGIEWAIKATTKNREVAAYEATNYPGE